MGKLTPFAIQFLRDVREFLGVTFKVSADEHSHTTLFVSFIFASPCGQLPCDSPFPSHTSSILMLCRLSCMGVGFSNIGKKLQ